MNTNIKILEWYAKNGVTELSSKTSSQSLQAESCIIPKQNTSSIQKMSTPKIRLKLTNESNTLLNNAILEARNLADRATSIKELRDNLNNFHGCSLRKTAMNTVFSDGQENAKIMLIGEAPGANEDIEGIPFCGDSGKLLDKIFLSIDIDRKKNLYITNTIFWRPPGNRKPTDLELQCCLPFLEKHIALINPKLLILAGSTASSALLQNTSPISRQRQQVFSYTNQYLKNDITTVVIFHPSYLLRQPSQKKSAWYDMLFISTLL